MKVKFRPVLSEFFCLDEILPFYKHKSSNKSKHGMTSEEASKKKKTGDRAEVKFVQYALRKYGIPGRKVNSNKVKTDVILEMKVNPNISVKGYVKVIQWSLNCYNHIREWYGDRNPITKFCLSRINNNKDITLSLTELKKWIINKKNLKKVLDIHIKGDSHLLAVEDKTGEFHLYTMDDVVSYIVRNGIFKCSEQQLQLYIGDRLLMSIEFRSDKKCLLLRQDRKALDILVLSHLKKVIL